MAQIAECRTKESGREHIYKIFNLFERRGSTFSTSVISVADHDWDILIFAQHWPISVCLQWKEVLPQHTCTYPNSSIWTIHGIWPTKLETKGPVFCNSSLHFNATALEPIKEDLQQYWHDMHNGTSSKNQLWKHEWKKHGTCAVSLPTLDTEAKYFKQGLEWIKEYDMINILAKSGIQPNYNYTPQAIWDAVQKTIGKNPTIQCIGNSKTKQSYLFQIRICFDKNLTLVDCDGIKEHELSSGILSNCPNHNITYPLVMPPVEDYDLKSTTFDMHYWMMESLYFIQFLEWMTF